MRRTAFTLLELLIVLALMTTLFGLGYATFRRQYARAQFKNGVFELQVDLTRTRLLAMRTGTPYLFRFAPGTGIYEIAPVEALQEAIYRQNGDFGDSEFSDGSVGGSLGGVPGDSALGANGGYGFDGTAVASRFADDLFSPENVAADWARYRGTAANGFAAGGFDASASVVGGSLSAAPIPTADATWGAVELSTGGATLDGFSADALTAGLGVSAPTTIRELTTDEKALLVGNVLAWRVGVDGAIFRKELTGNVVFTFERVSKSTRLNLRSERPDGLEAKVGADENASASGAFQSELTGSLTKIPGADATGAATDSSLGGGLSELGGAIDGFNGLNAGLGTVAPAPIWSEPIVFFPNGRTSTAVCGLASCGELEYYSEISLRGMTGVPRVSSISALPPGYDPTASALTQEELFRLANPGSVATNGVGVVGANGETTAATGALGDGSLGGVSDGDLLGGSSASGTETPANDGFETLYDSSVDGVGTAESGARRSGYRFDAPPESGPIGVPLDGAATQNLNGVGTGLGGGIDPALGGGAL